MSPATFTHSVHSFAAPSHLWQALQRPQVWSAITGIDQVYQPNFSANGQLEGFGFSATIGGRSYAGTARVTDRLPPARMELHIATTELDGRILIELGAGAVTQVTMAMSVEPSSFTARLAFGLIRAAIGSGFPASVEQFVTQLESVEQP